MKRDRTIKVLMSLTRQQSNELGLQVEKLIKNEMSYIVNKYVRQYRSAALDTFGWTSDDLMQHIRLILFKGMATFDPSKNFKITTYLSTILYYQMGNFSKTCQSNKNSNSKIYCPETLHPADEITTKETAEDWYSYMESFKILMGKLNEREKQILYLHLVDDYSIGEMETETKIPRAEIVGIIKSLKVKINQHMMEERKDEQSFKDLRR